MIYKASANTCIPAIGAGLESNGHQISIVQWHGRTSMLSNRRNNDQFVKNLVVVPGGRIQVPQLPKCNHVSGNSMGKSFSDITLYTPTPHAVGTIEYWEDTALKNYVSDLYLQRMYSYKPPKTSRITIQPAFHGIWDRTWRNGSILAIAPYYSHDEYASFDKYGKYKYILDLIQVATLQLSEEYKWDKSVFKKAYQEVIDNDFTFIINYPTKLSRDKKKAANLSIEKTEILTSVYVNIEANGLTIKTKLFDKENMWWYDCVYLLARHNKWLDTSKFGICYSKAKIDIWYSIEEKKVGLFEDGKRVTEINFKKYFLFG